MRLNIKILLVTILVLSIALTASSIVNLLSFRTNYTDALLTGSFGIGHSINSVLNEMLALGLPLESLSGMDQRLADVVEQSKHITYVGISRLDGRAIFHSNPAIVGQQFSDHVMQTSAAAKQPIWQLYDRFDGRSYYDVTIPIVDPEKRHIGVIRLGFARSMVDDKLVEAITQNLINLLLTFSVIALLLNFLLRRFISQPVEQLSAYAQRISEGQFEQPTQIRTNDELGQLSHSLMRMASSLEQHIGALELSRQRLEAEVEERTRELASANATLQSNNRHLSLAVERERELSDQAQRNEEALRSSEERFRRMFEDSGDALLLLDLDRFVMCNQATLEMLHSTSADQVIGLHPWELSPPTQGDGQSSREKAQQKIQQALDQGSTRFEWTHRRMNGELFPVEVLLTPIDYAGRRLLHTVWRDITARKEAEAQIHALAFYDPLTNLANRRLFIDRLEQARIANLRSGEFGALMLLDLDHFKTLNDTQGHDVGDQLLGLVAQRLLSTVRQRDTVSRLGGDEFVIMLTGQGTQAEQAAHSAELVAEKVRTTLNQPYSLAGQSEGYHISCSLGMTLFDGSEESAEAVLKHADLALYRAKESGRNLVRFFDPQMQAKIDLRAQLEGELHRALQEQEFTLAYQPQIDATGRVFAAEALLRWQRPDSEAVLPDEFIPLAEENGLILPLGELVLESVCQKLSAWAGLPHREGVTLAVNISARQLHHPDFVEQVSDTLKRTGANPQRLTLELTESAVLGNRSDAREKMLALGRLGIRFSLDDFGTGYSSLSNLKLLPVSQVKIDRSFIHDLSNASNDAAIVIAIIGMANSLAISVIAEGVENEQQRDFLIAHGCHAFQGYLYARPMQDTEFEQCLDQSEIGPPS